MMSISGTLSFVSDRPVPFLTVKLEMGSNAR